MLNFLEACWYSWVNLMDGTVHPNEFVLNGNDKGKVGRAYNTKKKKFITADQLFDNMKKIKNVCCEYRSLVCSIS
jgi:abortive infection bacteriophage resistance protein